VEQVSERQTLRYASCRLPVILAVMSMWMEVKLDVLFVQQGRNFIKENASFLVLLKLTLTSTPVKVKVSGFCEA